MTMEHRDSPELDDLLRRAFADDLPADAEAGMRERIKHFRAGAMEDERPTAARAGLFRKSAWAVLSVLMLVAGILLQGLGSRSRLAERIAQVKAEFSSSESTPRSGLTSEMRMTAPEERPVHFLNDKEKRS